MFLSRRPVTSARQLVTGVVLGVLAAFLLVELGAFIVLGLHRFDAFMAVTVGVALLLAIFDGLAVLLAIDAALVVLYSVIAFTPIIAAPVARWVRNDATPAGRLDAVVVLSGYVKSDTALESVAVERLLTGMELIKAGVAPRLITTRVVAQVDGRRITSDLGQYWLVHLAGLESNWTEMDSVGTTRDEATRVAALLLPAGGRAVAVVTSPMHTRRACATFEATGLLVRCVAARESMSMTWHPTGSHDRLAAFRDYLYEQLGMLKYRFKGWIRS